MFQGKESYHIKWVGDVFTTWEPRSNLYGCTEMLEKFDRNRRRYQCDLCDHSYENLGTISHKISIIKIFGHKHMYKPKLSQNLTFYKGKISTSFDCWLNWFIFDKNGSCDQKLLLIKYFKDYNI